MPQPFDYRVSLANIQNPTDNLINALNIGSSLLAIKEKQAAAQVSQNMQADFESLGSNPSPYAIAQLATKYPQMSEDLQRVHNMLNEEQRNAKVSRASEVYAALQANNPEIAKQLLEEQSIAFANAGDEQESKVLSDFARLVELSPDTAKITAGTFLASAMGPEKFTETFTKLEANRRASQLEGAELTEKQAKARKAAVEANFAESNATMDLQKKGWDIYKLQEDVKIAKENSKIAALNAQISREANQLKEEMSSKLEDMKLKRDAEVQQRASELRAYTQTIDNSVNTIDRLLKNPELDNVVGSLEGASFYPSTLFALLNPLADSDVRVDATADIENIQSQQFIDNLIQTKEKGLLSVA